LLVPEAPDTERLFALGIAAMFGSLLVHGLVAALVGRLRSSFEAGLAVGMLLFGLTALGIGAVVAWVVFVQCADVQARLAGCEPVVAADRETAGAHRLHFVAVTGEPLRLVTAPAEGPCPNPPVQEASPLAGAAAQEPAEAAGPSTLTLRHRRAAVPAGSGPTPAERVDDPRQASIAVGVFATFGGFWFLAGLTVLASRRESRQPAVERPVSAARARWATTFTVIGNLLLVGCVVGASLTDWDAERATRFTFRGVTLACVSYAVAMALRRQLTLATALTLLIIGGGFALAAWSLAVLG
jgi:hypothetical protein